MRSPLRLLLSVYISGLVLASVLYPQRGFAKSESFDCAVNVLRQLLQKDEFLPLGNSVADAKPIYSKREELFANMRKNLSEKDFKKFEEYYYSHYFFDRDVILTDNLAKDSSNLSSPTIYNKKGEYPFDGYLAARKQLFSKYNLDTLDIAGIKDTQTAMLSAASVMDEHKRNLLGIKLPAKNSEGTLKENLGQFRGSQVGFYTNNDKIRHGQVILSDGTVLVDSPSSYRELHKTNEMLKKRSDLNFVDYIPLSDWKTYRNKLSPSTIDRILNYESMPKKSGFLNLSSKQYTAEGRAVQQQVISDLLQDSLKQFRSSVKEAKTQDDIVNAIGNFHYDFISIHPFINGNGRTARVLTERFLDQYGLPPPIWSKWGEDVALSRSDFNKLFKDSLRLSDNFHSDLESVVKSGLDYHVTPTPHLTADVLNQNHKYLTPEEFMTWVSSSKRKASSTDQALKDFEKWKRDYSYEYQVGGVRFATPLFEKTFNKLSADESTYRMKMREFYGPRLLHRGLALAEQPSNEDIVKNFAQMRPSMIGMGVSSTSKTSMSGIFSRFNEKLARNPKALEKQIGDHVVANKGYWNSNFISYSTDQTVSGRFKNGYMMPVDFKNNMKSRFEITVRDRKVAAYDGSADTANFKAKGYANEKEVLLLGGTDPESVDKIVVEDISVKSLKPSKGKKIDKWSTVNDVEISRKRVAERIDFDTIRLTEYDSKGAISKFEYYKIKPDGSVDLTNDH